MVLASLVLFDAASDEEYAAAITVVKDDMLVMRTAIAFIAMLLYDHCITLSLEMKTVWSMRWGLPKVLFMVNRYIVPALLLFNSIGNALPIHTAAFCHFFSAWQAWPGTCAIVIVELFIVIRVSALYGHQRRLTAMLLALLFGMTGGSIYFGTQMSTLNAQQDPSPPPLTGCSITAPPFVYIQWLQGALFESLTLSLTMYKVLPTMFGRSTSSTLRPMLHLIARDSLVYFAIMFVLMLANTILFWRSKTPVQALLTLPNSAFACLAVSRMMMNMRLQYLRETVGGDDTDCTPSGIFELTPGPWDV